MEANIKKENVYGIRGSHREAEIKNGVTAGYKAVAIIGGELVTLADMRIAVSKSGTSYACFWAHRPAEKGENGNYISDGMWSNGSGTSSGCGCHNGSAAAGKAIRAAGFSLSENIDGRGDSAIRDAVLAVGKALYNGDVYIVECGA